MNLDYVCVSRCTSAALVPDQMTELQMEISRAAPCRCNEANIVRIARVVLWWLPILVIPSIPPKSDHICYLNNEVAHSYLFLVKMSSLDWLPNQQQTPYKFCHFEIPIGSLQSSSLVIWNFSLGHPPYSFLRKFCPSARFKIHFWRKHCLNIRGEHTHIIQHWL